MLNLKCHLNKLVDRDCCEINDVQPHSTDNLFFSSYLIERILCNIDRISCMQTASTILSTTLVLVESRFNPRSKRMLEMRMPRKHSSSYSLTRYLRIAEVHEKSTLRKMKISDKNIIPGLEFALQIRVTCKAEVAVKPSTITCKTVKTDSEIVLRGKGQREPVARLFCFRVH